MRRVVEIGIDIDFLIHLFFLIHSAKSTWPDLNAIW
jgi:hypothetical protein